MHHLPAVTIYNKESAGGRGTVWAGMGGVGGELVERGWGEVRGRWWHRDCMRARENANRFSEGYTVQQRT